ncbi:MAG: MgtC/SapB family protein [Candidatus Aminicenantes bacterium]|nr:MgtC/SapB family protein [Candidatus Aminicenantes bacterium]
MEIEIILKILLSAVLGGLVGLEREISHKEAGLRTNILIAVGSTLLTVLSLKLAENSAVADPGRLTAQIITGIGFIGAGAIIQARFAVHGLTTAATIWTVAAIGIGVGSGYYLISLLVAVFVVVILGALKYISAILDKQKKPFIYIVKTEDKARIFFDIKKVIRELGIKYVNANLIKMKEGFEIDLILTTSDNKNKEFIEKIMQLKGVKEVNSENL